MDPKAEQQASDEFELQLTRLQLIKPIYSAVNVIQRNDRARSDGGARTCTHRTASYRLVHNTLLITKQRRTIGLDTDGRLDTENERMHCTASSPETRRCARARHYICYYFTNAKQTNKQTNTTTDQIF